MGLDQFAGFLHNGTEILKHHWRKHPRLQVFFAKEFKKQQANKQPQTGNEEEVCTLPPPLPTPHLAKDGTYRSLSLRYPGTGGFWMTRPQVWPKPIEDKAVVVGLWQSLDFVKVSSNNLTHLGFNAGEGGVKIDEAMVNRLDQEIRKGYPNCVAQDGFFWGHEFQEEAVRKYKDKDKFFVKWCKEQLQEGRCIMYDCSW